MNCSFPPKKSTAESNSLKDSLCSNSANFIFPELIVRGLFKLGLFKLGLLKLGLILFALVFCAFGVFPTSAFSQEYSYSISPGPIETKQISHRAGQTELITTSYNAATKRFIWEMSFTPSPETGWLPNGLYFVVNNGFFPKGRQAEMAMLFFDATDSLNPKLTAYAYNGNNAGDSWKIGNFGGSQPPDKIISSIANPTWINSLKVTDLVGLRVFSIDIDVSLINQHVPIYPSIRWVGLQYDSFIGIWAHPVANMKTSYGPDGFLTLRSGNEGYVDVARDLTAGCDGVPGSGKQDDICGVCGGDGSTCGSIDVAPTPVGTPPGNPPPGNPPTDGIPPSNGNPNVEGDPSCSALDVKDTLLVLDSRAGALKNIALLAAARVPKLTRSKSLRKAANKDKKLAEKLYVSGWTSIWSVPSIIISCSGEVRCTRVDVASKTQTYTQSITKLSNTINRLLNLLRRANKKKSSALRAQLKAKANLNVNAARADVLGIPSVSTQCS